MERITQQSLPPDATSSTQFGGSGPVSLLPPELLLKIFELVYADRRVPVLCPVRHTCEACANCNQSSLPVPPCETDWMRDDILSPTLFPYALASVSTFWRDVMSLAPHFWTCIVVLVDTEPSLSDIHSSLQWSRELPIEVTITQVTRTDISADREVDENRLVRNITALLRPHVRRIKRLHYNVTYTSSLPLISANLYGTAPYLKELFLESSIDNNAAISGGDLQRFSGRHKAVHLPLLERVHVDGCNFFELCRHASRDEEDGDTAFSLITRLSVEHFRPSELLGTFSLNDALRFVRLLPHLRYLTFRDVEFDTESLPGTDSRFHFHFQNLLCLVFSDMSTRQLAEALSFCHTYSTHTLSIIRCSLNGIQSIPSAACLKIDGIQITEDVGRLIASWTGWTLHVSNCSGLGYVLESLTNKWLLMTHGSGVVLSKLVIHNCSDFSGKQFRTLVRARQDSGLSLDRFNIVLRGGAPHMFSEDIDWLTENMSFQLCPDGL